MWRKGVHVLLLTLILGPILILATGGVAFAHGERAQEGFLRMKTVAWQDVRFSSDKVKQGEQLIITGRVKILESWPTTLAKPEQAFLNVSASGPHLAMKERYINGEPAPAAIFVQVGGVYDFKMVLEGRTPGYWHVHPTFYVLHTGGLIGPGQWTTVTEVPGGYQNKVTLTDGQVINLDTYGTGWVFWFSFLGFVPGVWWMLWWTMKHRTVTNPAVTLQIPLNDPGEDIGLITKADHRTSTLIVVVSVILLVLGWLFMERAWPTRIPQQVLRITPEPLPEPVTFAQGKGLGAIYDPKTDTLVLDSQVTNTGKEPMKLVAFTTANLTFDAGKGLVAEPATVDPGRTVKLKVTVKDKVWSEERLIPLDKPQMGVAGLLVFESGGKKNAVTTEAPVKPTSFR